MKLKGLIMLIVLCGCTTAKPLADGTLSKENLIQQLDMDKRIWVLKKDSEEYRSLKIEAIEKDYLLSYNK